MNTVEPCWRSGLFPQYVFEAVPALQIKQSLQEVFTGWGRPESLRVDNGSPWGNRQQLPSTLTLWLVGLGIEVIHNRPYCPKENSKVERSHGVVKRWVEPAQCRDLEDLKERLNQATRLQREHYPSCSGHTRWHCYPALAHPLRPYGVSLESELWQFSRVCQLLAHYRWSRKVSKTGQISLYNRNYSVGRSFGGQMVSVRFDSSAQAWVIEDVQGQTICRHRFKELTPHAVQTMKLTHSKKRKRAKEGA